MNLSRNGASTDNLTSLTDLAVHIPGVLEAADDALIRHSVSAMTQTKDRCMAILFQLEDFAASRFGGEFRPDPELLDITLFQRFHRLCGDMTFPQAFQFETFIVAYVQTLYWLCLCFVQATLLSLLRFVPDAHSADMMQTTGANILRNIHNLCRTIPYFCEPNAGSIGLFATFMPLTFASTFFENQNMHTELRWCRSVSTAIYSHGIAPPFHQLKTGDASTL